VKAYKASLSKASIIPMPRTALFVIDIQGELAQDKHTEIPHARRIREAGDVILAKAREAIDRARANGQRPELEIVIVQHEEKPEDGTMIRGSKPWELVFTPRQSDDMERIVSKNVRK
jgi:nicotinamidase-related amidase